VIGRTITVDSRLNQIAGVMPADFRFYGFDPELIQTLGFDTGIKVTSATSASREAGSDDGASQRRYRTDVREIGLRR
jgi:hypothetical protein